MGSNFFDQYSLLHMASGIIFYFLGISLKTSIILHTIFEIIENSPVGMSLIQTISFWPGSKKKADSIPNSIGDIIFFILGWLCAKYLDQYFTINKLYII